jgi:hypothetical protein
MYLSNETGYSQLNIEKTNDQFSNCELNQTSYDDGNFPEYCINYLLFSRLNDNFSPVKILLFFLD